MCATHGIKAERINAFSTKKQYLYIVGAPIGRPFLINEDTNTGIITKLKD